MSRSKREIELDDEDWAEVDKDAGGYPAVEYLLHHGERLILAAYKVRPLEPRTVTVNHLDTYTWEPYGVEWHDGYGNATDSLAEDCMLDHIWNLEHPDDQLNGVSPDSREGR